MWPGMRPGDRVDRVAHADPLLLQQVGHLAQRVLGLRHRHAVARHDDHRGRVLHDERRILGAALLDRLLLLGAARRDRAALGAEAAEDDVEIERFMPLHIT
jgi:hypothetical protein